MPTNRAKLHLVFTVARQILDDRGDSVLAEIASSASVVINSRDETQMAVCWENVKGDKKILPSWPYDYLPQKTLALPVEQLANEMVGVLDQLDAHGLIER